MMSYTKQQKMLITSIALLICGLGFSIFAWSKVSLAGNAISKHWEWHGGWYDDETWKGIGAKYILATGLASMAVGGILLTLCLVKKPRDDISQHK